MDKKKLVKTLKSVSKKAGKSKDMEVIAATAVLCYLLGSLCDSSVIKLADIVGEYVASRKAGIETTNLSEHRWN